MSPFHLAQINIARLRAPIDAPEIKDFADNLDRINALAEGSPGFVWRLVGEGNDATDILAFDDPLMAINMSVWTDLDALAAFAYRSEHRLIMRRRREWFHQMGNFMALWWVAAGHRPTPAEGIARIETLARLGPTPDAFTFKTPFAAPNREVAPPPFLEECS